MTDTNWIDNPEQTLLQQVYFDLVDLLKGQTYKELGYKNKDQFLIEQINRLSELEKSLFFLGSL